MMQKYIYLGFAILLGLISSSAVADLSLTITNKTVTDFQAITVGGQPLPPPILKGQTTTIKVPFVPAFPTYAVLLEGEDGNNALVYDQGDGLGPQCSDQLTYYHCVFSGKLPKINVSILWP